MCLCNTAIGDSQFRLDLFPPQSLGSNTIAKAQDITSTCARPAILAQGVVVLDVQSRVRGRSWKHGESHVSLGQQPASLALADRYERQF